jgi:hypothetical protein
MDGPGKAVVAGRNHRGVSGSAILVGNIGSSVRAHFDVAVQAAAISQSINWHRGTIGKATVQADGAGRINDALRAVINGMLISNRRREPGNQAGCERPAADCLMIDSGRNSAAYRRRVACAVIVTERGKATRTGKLRDKGSASGGVSEHDGIERDERRDGTQLFPRGRGAVDGDAVSLKSGLEENFPGVPIRSDGWLTRAGGKSGGWNKVLVSLRKRCRGSKRDDEQQKAIQQAVVLAHRIVSLKKG